MAVAYINLYLSGYYHRMGKPEQFNVHPGDMYPTRAAAEADCHPRELYVGTFPVLLGALGNTLVPNPADSVPIDLETSKEAYASFGIEGLVDLMTQHCGSAPLQLDQGAPLSAQQEAAADQLARAEMVLDGEHPWIEYDQVVAYWALDTSFQYDAATIAPYVDGYLNAHAQQAQIGG